MTNQEVLRLPQLTELKAAIHPEVQLSFASTHITRHFDGHCEHQLVLGESDATALLGLNFLICLECGVEARPTIQLGKHQCAAR